MSQFQISEKEYGKVGNTNIFLENIKKLELFGTIDDFIYV